MNLPPELDTPLSGILVVDKPQGPTSHTIVHWIRRILGIRKVGHAGTLDPLATGVLVLGVGKGTKLLGNLTADDKEYTADIRLGLQTDTLDSDGKPTCEAPVPAFTQEDLDRVCEKFKGEISQEVPAFSAVKQGGEALYKRARRGDVVVAPVRAVQVHHLALQRIDAERISLHCLCSKGTYVRSLARDVAVAIGTVGHVTALRRLRSGEFTLEGAIEPRVLAHARAGDASAAELIQNSVRQPPPLAAVVRGPIR